MLSTWCCAVEVPRHPHGLALDRDAALALDVHPVEVLRAHRPVVDDAGDLQHPVGQGRLAVVDVGDDAEVADRLLRRGVRLQRDAGAGGHERVGSLRGRVRALCPSLPRSADAVHAPRSSARAPGRGPRRPGTRRRAAPRRPPRSCRRAGCSARATGTASSSSGCTATPSRGLAPPRVRSPTTRPRPSSCTSKATSSPPENVAAEVSTTSGLSGPNRRAADRVGPALAHALERATRCRPGAPARRRRRG